MHTHGSNAKQMMRNEENRMMIFFFLINVLESTNSFMILNKQLQLSFDWVQFSEHHAPNSVNIKNN